MLQTTPLLPAPWARLQTSNNAPSPRVGHTLTFISSSQCLMFGGASHEEGYLDEVWILQLDTLTWRRPKVNSAVPPPRYEHCASLFYQDSDGKITPKLLIFGGAGEQGVLNDVWTLDLATYKWTLHEQNGPTPCPRTLHFAAWTGSDGITDETREQNALYVFGGGGLGDKAVPDQAMWRLDIASMNWTQCPSKSETPSNSILPKARLGHSMTFLRGRNEILLFGGMAGENVFADTWVFNIESREWRQIMDSGSPHARSGHASCMFSNNAVIFGGMYKDADRPEVLADMWIFDSETYKWRLIPTSQDAVSQPVPRPRLDMGMCTVRKDCEVEGFQGESLEVDRVEGLTRESHECVPEVPSMSVRSKIGVLVNGGMDFQGMFNDAWVCWIE